MKNTNKSRDDVLRTLSAKREIIERFPMEKTVYTDVVEYCKNECWGIDDERMNTDVDYRLEKVERMNNYNLEAQTFNALLNQLAEFLYTI